MTMDEDMYDPLTKVIIQMAGSDPQIAISPSLLTELSNRGLSSAPTPTDPEEVEPYEEQAPISQILDAVCKRIAFILPFMHPIIESLTEDPDQGVYLFDFQIDWGNSKTHLYFRRRSFPKSTVESLDIDTCTQILYEDLCSQILYRIQDIMFNGFKF